MEIYDLESIVVWEFYCNLDLFWENVGRDRDKVLDRVSKAKTKKELVSIINEYI